MQPSQQRHPVKVRIVYCASCGYEPQTIELASALMRSLTYDLASIEIIPWEEGSFDVAINGELVHSMYEHGGFPAADTIVKAARERVWR